MNRILASVLVTINALLGFVLIMGSIAFAKFAFERIYSGELPPDVFPYANMIAIGLPVFGIALAAYLCGMIVLLALIEGHLKAIKEQGELYRPNKARERSEPKMGV